MGSVWKDGVTLPSFKTFSGEKKTDVLIIGGGLCGLLCAHLLKEAGVDCMVLEADTIASGTTGNTTGKITALHGLIYDKLLHSVGKEGAQMYLSANLAALKQYRRLAGEMDCDFETQSAYTYSLEDREKIEREVTALQSLGADAHFSSCPDLPFDPAGGAVRLDGQAQFHPLKFVAKLAEKLPVYEHSAVREIQPSGVRLPHGRVTAQNIIVATHFPFLNKHGSYFLKLYQHRSYLLSLENVPQLSGMYVDENKTGMSFRKQGELLLVGGGGHRTGKQGGAWREIERFVRRFYPHARITHRWAAQDCMSLDSVPYIGQYSAKTPRLYVASGFNKWGMSGAMVAARLLTDRVLAKQTSYASVFSPTRSILKPQLLVNGAEAVVNLLTPTAKRCPHLGCALKWNKAEHTWDCPCHGSRFTAKGKLIDNPATGDADLK